MSRLKTNNVVLQKLEIDKLRYQLTQYRTLLGVCPFDKDVLKGDVGPPGPITPGVPGPQGEQGIQGIQGPTGDIGPQGPQGLPGSNGRDGLTGETGPRGTTGLKGDRGDTGLTGSIGPIGLTGPKGDVGERGSIGPKGDKGDTGTTGLKGDTGNQGPQGNPGPVGEASTIPGPVGNPGLDGKTILSGTVVPPNTLGTSGDFYINTSTYLIYYKTGAAWGVGVALKGTNGLTGTAGKTILSGSTTPPAAVGTIGDFYIDKNAMMFYGPKVVAANWTGIVPVSLVGSTGSSGTSVTAIKVADEATAISQSTANPNNIYYW